MRDAAPPSSLLLATDLSARCDRALDRAVLLARQWQARLVVATVTPPERELEAHGGLIDSPPWQRAAHLANSIEQRLRRDLAPLDVMLDVRVETGAIGPALLRVAQREHCGLLVTGVGRDALFARPRLGSTVTWLSRHAPMPLLVVQRRPSGPYRSMVLASDFSPAASHALAQALSLFGTPQSLALLHGYGLARVGARDVHARSAREDAARSVAQRSQAFLASLELPQPLHAGTRCVDAQGDPARLLRDFVNDHDSELAIVGNHGRSALRGLLLGDVAQRMLGAIATDTLLVRQPREHAAPHHEAL